MCMTVFWGARFRDGKREREGQLKEGPEPLQRDDLQTRTTFADPSLF